MKITENLHEKIVGQISFPLLNYLMNRRAIKSQFKKFKKSEYYAVEKVATLQFAKLKAVLTYANQWVPFYQKRFKEVGFEVGDLKELSDLKMIPPLEREDLINYHSELIDTRYQKAIEQAARSNRGPGIPHPLARFKRLNLVRNTSSGSTGAPTTFYENGSLTALNWAYELRLRSWYGIKPGAPEARMVRISNEHFPGNKTNTIRKLLWNQLILPGINLSDDHYSYSVREILDFRPRVLWGFTAALAGLAGYIDQQGLSLEGWLPQLVITWAAPLYDHEREILEKIFRCPVSNIYGMREIGHIAMQCPEKQFHINHESLLIEPVESRENVGDNNLYELVGTTLDPGPMPFIRYRTGDLGNIVPSQCSCGRTMPVIERLVGRTGEVFHSKEGRMISPNFWCRLFMTESLSGAINRFQVEYKASKDISLTIERGPTFLQETEQTIRNKFYKSFSDQTKFDIQYIEKIKPATSGKYKMVFHENRETAT